MRSLLFVPADSPKKFAKGMGSGADALILDLEDSVALPNKVAARSTAVDALKEGHKNPARPRLYVRMNALDTPFWQGDLSAVMPARPDGIMLPKPRNVGDVVRVADEIGRLEMAQGVLPGTTTIIAIVSEVPESVLSIAGYAQGPKCLEALTWGAEDLSAMLGSQSTREDDGRWTSPYMLARNLTLMAASAGGRAAIDTVYVDFKNKDGFADECRRAARDGFTGKMAIHPDQVAMINEAFTPSAAERAWAEEITALFAQNPGAGTLALRGQMIDRPHLVRAERILKRSRGT
ncbi:MAG: citrate lyase [Pseudomonadota bacterium]|jgi:citrate lyase subunit beta/citryl-CoA lyase